MQTDVLAKSQGVTLAHRLFTQSFQLCFPNIETAGAYLSRKNISFWKATSVVGAGEEKQSFFFFLPFHLNMALYLCRLFHSLKCSLQAFEITAVETGRSLVSRFVHIHSWKASFKIRANFEPYERNSHGSLGHHYPQDSLMLSQTTRALTTVLL